MRDPAPAGHLGPKRCRIEFDAASASNEFQLISNNCRMRFLFWWKEALESERRTLEATTHTSQLATNCMNHPATQPEATSADHGRPNDGTGLDKQPPPVCTSSLGRGCPDRRRPAQGRLLGDGAAAAPRAANRLSRRARSTIGADRLLPPPAAEPRRNQLHGACMCHDPAHAAAGWRRPRSTAS